MWVATGMDPVDEGGDGVEKVLLQVVLDVEAVEGALRGQDPAGVEETEHGGAGELVVVGEPDHAQEGLGSGEGVVHGGGARGGKVVRVQAGEVEGPQGGP